MENLNAKYRAVKEELKKRGCKTDYFTPETFNTIMADRDRAAEEYRKAGSVQEFYRNSKTTKTDFYNKNSGTYCEMLEVLNGMQKGYRVYIKSNDVGGTFEFEEIADNEKQAGFYALKDCESKYPHWKNGIRIDDIRRI